VQVKGIQEYSLLATCTIISFARLKAVMPEARGGEQTFSFKENVKKNLSRAGWPTRLALVQATPRAEVDVLGVR